MSENLLGRYELLSLIGEGAMGAVYRARDTSLERMVALKVMNAAMSKSPEAMARFKREARSLALLQHPGIVTIFDILDVFPNLCLVMELIPGRPLDQVIGDGTAMTVAQKLRFMAQVCHALHYAHQQGVIHRDLKPSNILMLPTYSPKIVDFGIAKVVGEKLTRTNTRMGTIAYMSPEQFDGENVDHRTDIFSAGALLYELLSGVSPFEGTHTTVIMKKIILIPTPALPDHVTGVSPAVQRVIAKSLEKEASARYNTALELAQAIEASLTAGVAQGQAPRFPGPSAPPPAGVAPHPSAFRPSPSTPPQLRSPVRPVSTPPPPPPPMRTAAAPPPPVPVRAPTAPPAFLASYASGANASDGVLGQVKSMASGVLSRVGAAVSFEQASAELEAAAAAGDAEAQYRLGNAYLAAANPRRNVNHAIKLFENAAGQRHVLAQLQLGRIFGEGIGVLVDIPRSVFWLKKAAVGGSYEAQQLLGSLWIWEGPDTNVKRIDMDGPRK